MKSLVRKVELPKASLAEAASAHPGSEQDERSVNTVKWACSNGVCKRRACSLARTSWCKDFLVQKPIPWKPAPRGKIECPKTQWGMCNRVGNCNYDFGICECPAGWTGADCGTRQPRSCTNRLTAPTTFMGPDWKPLSNINASNMDADPMAPGSTLSRCLGYCDDDVGSCWCPPGTKYGRIPAPPGSPPGTPPLKMGRPIGVTCKPGTLWNGKGSGYGLARLKWEHLMGPKGWCNADSLADLALDVAECRDCGPELDGPTCSKPNDQFCLNQCTTHGTCNKGFCKCDEGWYGADCSRKRAGLPTGPGQQPGQPNLNSSLPVQHLTTTTVPAAMDPPPAPTRLRPLIYVYDMPPEFTTRMLQYRLVKGRGTWREQYNNKIMIPSQNYGAETYLHEMLMLSEHRTFDPEEADFFYVPLYITVYYRPVRAYADFPWYGDVPEFVRPYDGAHLMLKAKRWLQGAFPYWNRRQGRDHIWFLGVDEGACYMPSEIFNTSIILTHWGKMDQVHLSESAYGPDNYSAPLRTNIIKGFPKDRLQEDWRDIYRGHACYDPKKDLVLPQMKAPGQYKFSPLLGTAPLKRDILLMFRGDVGYWRRPWYSRGVRQKLALLAHKHNWAAQRVAIGDTDALPYDYGQLLARSVFCAAATGDGWATRIEDAIQHGCIPVIIHDQVHGPFENILDYDSFSIRIKESAVNEDLPKVLAAIPKEQIELMQRRISAIMPRFTFAHGPAVQDKAVGMANVSLPAVALVKQPAPKGHPIDTYARLPVRIDALSTIIQWLHSRIPATR